MAARGSAYIASRQTEGGAFFAPDTAADAVAEALVAAVAGGTEAETIGKALAYLARAGPERARAKPAYAGRVVLGLVAVGRDPRAFANTDFVALARSRYNAATGAFDSNLYANALAGLGVVASGERLDPQALSYVRANRCAEGSWSWQEACLRPADVDTTALTIALLAAAGIERHDESISRARDWLAGVQAPSGGWGNAADEAVNANSTGLALLAIASLRESPAAPPWAGGGRDPLSALASLQDASGAFRYRAGEAPADYPTVQAVIGASGKAYPIRASDRTATAGVRAHGPQESRLADSPAPSPARTVRPDEARGASQVTEARTTSTAGVLVVGADGEARRFCLLLDESTRTGLDLLRRTGLTLSTEDSALGTSVCAVDGTGCGQGQGCFCRYPQFWRYFTREPGGEWVFSELGATARDVRAGSLDAWVWGGDDASPPAADVGLEQVCAADEARPSAEGTSSPAGDRATSSRSGAYGVFVVIVLLLIAAAVVFASTRRRAAS